MQKLLKTNSLGHELLILKNEIKKMALSILLRIKYATKR